MKRNPEYDNFDRTMKKLMAVPHSEIKTKLESEKRGKAHKKRAKKPASRASGEGA